MGKVVGKIEPRISMDEEVVLIASPEIATELIERGFAGSLVICSFSSTESACIMVKKEDWNALIDKGEVYERKRRPAPVMNENTKKGRNNEKHAWRPERLPL